MATRQGNRAGRSAVIEFKSAALSGGFGMGMLRTKFPEQADEILARLGTYSRGPRKGLPRGYVTWEKVVEGGYDYRPSRRAVVLPGTQCWDVCESASPDSPSVIAAIAFDRRRREDAEHELCASLTPPWAKLLEGAARAHRRAITNLREGELYDFRQGMMRARLYLIEARGSMVGA